MKPVSAEIEGKLHAALDRLLGGCAAVTDGRLTVANLAREAGVSRATANRAAGVLVELRHAAATRRLAPEPSARDVDDGRSRRAVEHLLAQHIQARALLREAEERHTRRGLTVVSFSGQ